MSDLDKRRAEWDARRRDTDLSRSTRYADAVNRYLGAAGYRISAPVPAAAQSPPHATSATHLVLVGVDETPASYTAVDHAAIEAELRGWNLRILHVQRPGGARESSRVAGADLLERLAARVHAVSPSVAVTSRLAVGAASSLLLSEATGADLLVVGNRHGRASATFGLSVADRLASHHAGVLLVVRMPNWPPGPGFAERPIVVGVEQPGATTPAVEFGLHEARLRGCDLVILHARPGLAPSGRAETVDGVSVRYRTADADPAAALIDFSHRAGAVVVGRGDSGGHRTALGSVGRAMVQHAGCPVFLV